MRFATWKLVMGDQPTDGRLGSLERPYNSTSLVWYQFPMKSPRTPVIHFTFLKWPQTLNNQMPKVNLRWNFKVFSVCLLTPIDEALLREH